MYIWRLFWGGGRGLAKFWLQEGRCVDLVLTRGREGVKNPENLADIICHCPLGQVRDVGADVGRQDRVRGRGRPAARAPQRRRERPGNILECCRLNAQGSAKRWFSGCVNAAEFIRPGDCLSAKTCTHLMPPQSCKRQKLEGVRLVLGMKNFYRTTVITG